MLARGEAGRVDLQGAGDRCSAPQPLWLLYAEQVPLVGHSLEVMHAPIAKSDA